MINSNQLVIIQASHDLPITAHKIITINKRAFNERKTGKALQAKVIDYVIGNYEQALQALQVKEYILMKGGKFYNLKV